MKKKLFFGLAAVTTICACGLVIDPDKLVEGNATPLPDNEAGADTSTGETDGGGPDSGDEAGDSGVVEVPECVPPLPSTTGAQGPYAVVAGKKGASIACPTGYLPTPVEQGDSEVVSPPAECNSAAGCSCGAGTGTAKCGLRVRYYDDNQCVGQEADTPTTVGGFTGCADLDSEDFVKLETTVSGVTCAPSGTTAPTAKAPPSFGSTTIVCAPDPNVKTAQCKGEDIPLPAAKNAAACIIVPTTTSCSGDYRSTRLLSKAGTFNDTRGCACGCTANAAVSCSGGSAKMWSSFLCTGTATPLAIDACQPRGGGDTINTDSAPTPSGTLSCTTRATPTGDASPTIDLKLCCLGSGGGGDDS